MIKVQFKQPFKRNVLKKQSENDQISCHQDLNLETRVKRSILWNIGNTLKAKIKNDFSISRNNELCLILKNGDKKFLKYHESILKFKNHLKPEDIEKAYNDIKDPKRENCSAILLL